eukprot:GHRR01001407.1.p2 GENE.GHRR01001407.1~~GHRR01001407.1.p2  ORF type:complete len:121 (+),score=38.42 GHRR01001407.1:208-570(+)
MALKGVTAPRTAFFGSNARMKVAAVARPTVNRQVVKSQAFFGFGSGGNKSTTVAAAPQYYICVDCGYIYDRGDFKKAPDSYKCPVCKSAKSRFKVYKGAVKGKPSNTGAALQQRFKARQW